MTAGFPTDDPWGDRQQGLPIDAFDELLAAGVSFNWAPGTRFEYSNLGYAILGRVRDDGVRRPLRRVHQDPAARAARPDQDRLPRRRIRARRTWPSATGTGPAAGRRCRSTRTARSRRWAACSRPSPTSRAGWPGSRRRSRPTAAVGEHESDAHPLRTGVAAADAAAAGGDRLALRRAGCPADRPRRPSTTGSACSWTRTRRLAGWSRTAAGTPGSGPTCAGTRPPASA